MLKNNRWILAALACAWLAAAPAQADVNDYEFQLLRGQARVGEAEVAVRLLHKGTGRAVPGAVIFAKRIDMQPDGMEAMVSPLETLPSVEPGVYRFKTKLSMEGRWRLSLSAKVQGETGTLESKLILTVLP